MGTGVGRAWICLPAPCRRHRWEQEKLEASLSWPIGQGKMLAVGAADRASEPPASTVRPA